MSSSKKLIRKRTERETQTKRKQRQFGLSDKSPHQKDEWKEKEEEEEKEEKEVLQLYCIEGAVDG